MDQDVSFHLQLIHHVYLPAVILPTLMVTHLSSETIKPRNSSFCRLPWSWHGQSNIEVAKAYSTILISNWVQH